MDTWLVVFVGIIALCNLITLAAIVVLIVKLVAFLNTSVTPAMSKIDATLNEVKQMVNKVEDRADHIMEIGEDTAKKVSGSVAATTDLVQDSVTAPLISIASILTGISRAIETWRGASARA